MWTHTNMHICVLVRSVYDIPPAIINGFCFSSSTSAVSLSLSPTCFDLESYNNTYTHCRSLALAYSERCDGSQKTHATPLSDRKILRITLDGDGDGTYIQKSRGERAGRLTLLRLAPDPYQLRLHWFPSGIFTKCLP